MSRDETADGAQPAPDLVDPNGGPLRFEDALEELEGLVEKMEGGELSLEDSVACFERGMRLHRYCQQALESANQKVRVLIRRSEVVREGDLADFDEPASADDAP